MIIYAPISLGELIDKITILECKLEYITDQSKLDNCQKEYQLLDKLLVEVQPNGDPKLEEMKSELRSVNQKLWHIEDAKRACEQRQSWGPDFIELSRNVYKLNDRRAAIKKDINLYMGSDIVEEKSHRLT